MAKDVITRFKLETTAFDSAIRKASKELTDYMRTATQASEGFNNFTKSNIDAARALGTMSVSSSNLKDKLRELVNAYNEAAKAYNELTDAQKSSDFGKALSASLSQLQVRIRQTKTEMQGLRSATQGAGGGGMFQGGQLSGMIQVLGGNLMTKAAGWAMEAVGQMQELVKQSVEVYRAAEGIKLAYDRLNRPDLLDNLKEATHGTVSELELMKAAVKFNDFRLPVEELGTMLAFAQKKAKDTGQSVDYMVDSIVTGLGRKSLMILDNLGLSAAEIRERMKETGDMTKAVGAIIREQMEQAGEYIETSADKASRANADLQNALMRLGESFQPLSDACVDAFGRMKVAGLELLNEVIRPIADAVTSAGMQRKAYAEMGGNAAVQKQVDVLRPLVESGNTATANELYRNQVSKYQKEIADRQRWLQAWERWQKGDTSEEAEKEVEWARQRFGNSTRSMDVRAEMNAYNQMLEEYQKAYDELQHPAEVKVDTKQAEQSIESLAAKLKELEEQRRKAVRSGDNEQVEVLTRQINETKQYIGYLDPDALKTEKKTDREVTIQQQITDLEKEYITASEERRNVITVTIRQLERQLEVEQQLREEAHGERNFSEIDTRAVDLFAGGGMFTEQNLGDMMGQLKQAISTSEIGNDLYNALTSQLRDATALQQALQAAIRNGIDPSQLGLDDFWQQIFGDGGPGDWVADQDWQELADKINEELKNLGLDPIELKFDVKTGTFVKAKESVSDVDEEMKKTAKSTQMAGNAIGQMGSAIGAIETPVANVVGTVMQAVANVAVAASSAMTAAATKPESSGWAWLAFAASATATMISTIAAIHKATGYAQGGEVRGTSYSGDNIGALVDGQQLVGLNAGEIVLTRAMTGNLASQLQEGGGQSGGTYKLYTNAESIVTVLNAWGLRTGRGKIIR